MPLTIPLQPVPSQSLKVILSGQQCELRVFQKDQGLFVDLVADGVAIELAVLAQQLGPLVGRQYTGFVGNLAFIDTQGTDTPYYTGLGSRWQLLYLDPTDYAQL